MRLLVIGGLGYIGSELSHKLAKFADVTILDCDVFGSDYCPDNIKIIKSNVLDYKDFDQYDKIIIASDIDNEDFYEFSHYQGYLKNYRSKLVEISNTDAEVYYLYGYLESQLSQKAFMEGTIQKLVQSTHLIKTPSIYGDNIHVRSDTYINKILHDFLVYGRHVLNGNPAEVITFAPLMRYTDDLIEFIINEKPMPQYDRLPALLLANTVHWSLNEGAEFEIAIGVTAASGNIVPETTIRYEQEQELMHCINMMYQAISSGVTTELIREHSDHAHTLCAAMKGYGVTSKLLSP